MGLGLDKSWLAKDAYAVWKRRVGSATLEVRIFSPYLDSLVVRLLRNSSLGPEGHSVVTDLSPMSGALDYRRQLIAVRALLRDGIEVRTLERLHAKVLLIDGRHVTVGSQNFTSYARRSKEATVAAEDDLHESEFVATLEGWYLDSEPVTLGLVEQLLAALESQMRDLAETREALAAAYAQEWERFQEASLRLAAASQTQLTPAPFEDTLRAATNYARYRSAQGTVWAHLETIEGTWSDYQTLMAERGSDLTRWIDEGDWLADEITLQRYDFYPLIEAPSGRMAVVRITRTRITYVWRGVKFSGLKTIGDRSLAVDVSFPDPVSSGANISVEIGLWEGAPNGYRISLRFDGHHVQMISAEPYGSPSAWEEQLLRRVAEDLRSDQARLEELAQLVLGAFAPERVGIHQHNADQFFENRLYRLSMIDFLGCRVLVAE